MFLSVGRYRQAELVDEAARLTVFWPPDHATFAPELLGREPSRVLRFLRQAFGPPATEHLWLIEIPGDEVNNFVVDGLVAISRGSYARLERSPTYLSGMLAHELAHLWWGDLVNAVGPGARWLTEGFAEYCRYLYERAAGGEPLAWSYRNLLMVRQFAGRASPPLTGVEAIGEDEGLYYQKGAFVLQMLAGEIGEDTLLAVLRRFAQQYGGRTATVEDFIAIAGGRRMGWFFDQWLRRPDGPRLRLSATVEASGGGVVVRGAVEQLAPAYRLRVPLVAYGPHDTTVRTIALDGARADFTLRLPERPLRLELDPGATVFKWFTADELPLDFADAAQRVGTARCVFAPPSNDTTLTRRRDAFLSRRFPDVDTHNPRCPVRVLVGSEAAAFRRRYAAGVPDPETGAMSAFVERLPDGTGTVVGIEGAVEAWPDLLMPEAPLTFLRVRDGQIVAAWGAGLPRIEVRF
jgi:hypothetical protein